MLYTELTLFKLRIFELIYMQYSKEIPGPIELIGGKFIYLPIWLN